MKLNTTNITIIYALFLLIYQLFGNKSEICRIGYFSVHYGYLAIIIYMAGPTKLLNKLLAILFIACLVGEVYRASLKPIDRWDVEVPEPYYLFGGALLLIFLIVLKRWKKMRK
jgi:hypothetical protein